MKSRLERHDNELRDSLSYRNYNVTEVSPRNQQFQECYR